MKIKMKASLALTGCAMSLSSIANGAAIVSNALDNGSAAGFRTTFYTTTVGESPDFSEDFDSFDLGTVITNQVSGVVLSGVAATIEFGDISGSVPVGTAALEIPENGIADTIFTFDAPVDYFSFRDIDVAALNVTVNFFGGGTASFATETTAGSGNSAEFVGYFRNDQPKILSFAIDGSGTGGNTMGIDNLEFGSIPEPSTSLLFGLGGLVLLRRRR